MFKLDSFKLDSFARRFPKAVWHYELAVTSVALALAISRSIIEAHVGRKKSPLKFAKNPI